MTRTATPPALSPPRPIQRALRRVDGRLRMLASARGLGTASLLASLGAAIGMAVDFAWTLPSPARWAIWGIWTLALGSSLLVGVVRPWLRKSRWIDLAAVAERADPRLGERLTGSIALLDRDTPPNGSPALVNALVADAAGHVGEFDASLVKGPGRLALRLALGMVAVGLVVAPSLVRPDPFRTLALRFVAPWMDLERVSWFALTVAPGDKVAAVGSDFRVEARIAPRFGELKPPEAATLEWLDEQGIWHSSRMISRSDESASASASASKADRAFELTLPRLAGSIRYRVSTVGTRSRSYQVTAVEPPQVAAISARVEPPAYTRLPASAAKDPSKIEAVEGSRIALTIAGSSPVEKVELTWPTALAGKPREIETKLSPDHKSASATIEAEAGGPFVLTLKRDPHGIDGKPETRQLIVRADAPPTLAVKGPGARVEAKSDDVLQVGIAARDDFAVASVEIHYEIRKSKTTDETTPGHVALKLEGIGSTVARGTGSLPLRDLGLEPGDAVAYRVQVLDNRPAPKGPNVVWSDARTISIVANAEAMTAKGDRLRRESFQSRLDDIRKANIANRRETEQLRYAADAAQRSGSAWDAGKDADLAAREVEARSIEDKLQLLARDLMGDPTFEPLARPTRQAAEVEAEAGRAQLDQARKTTETSRRLAELRQADSRLGALNSRLDEIRNKFDALAKLDLDRQKLRELASKEDALANKAAQGAADKARLAADQDELRKALDSLLAQSPGLRSGLLAAQAEEAARLAKEARALAEKQRAEARKAANVPLREIAQAQKDLEDDARRLALDINEPLNENGRGGVDPESVRRAIEPIERGDLSDAVRKLDDSESNLRRLTQEMEDLPADPKALARRLYRRQEALANDVAAVMGEARKKDNLTPDEQAELAVRVKPLAERQEAIARLAAGLVPPEPQKGHAREATQATQQAADNLRGLKARESENIQNAAKRTLNQLAEALADPNRLREAARQKLEEAKRKEEEVLREVERQIAETQPRPDKINADATAASDLAEKVAPLIQKQREAAEALAKLDVEPRTRPQRDRAAARAARLADQIQAVKDQAPPRRAEPKPMPPARWTLLDPFPTLNPKVPFDPSKAVDLGAEIKDSGGKAHAWKPADFEGDDGKINLGRIFGQKDNHAAFAVSEIVSPTRRKATLVIGSDDTMTIWLNGKQVFDFGNSRSYELGQNKVDVELHEGVNRLAIRCGNGNGEWQFAVNVTPPPPDGFDSEKAKASRELLAQTRLEAQASLYRLEQKSQGRMPADDLAEILADEQKAAAEDLAKERSKPPEDDPTAREQAARDRQRLATAIRNLPVAPEAPALHAEAARLAEAATRPDADPKAAQLAAEAAAALSRRLADTLAPKDLAAALARAEHALEAPEVQADPAQVADRQKAIASELARSPERPASVDRAEKAVRAASALADRAQKPDPAKPSPTPAALAEAQAKAAQALDKMAADPALARAKPPAAPSPAASDLAATVPPDPALGLGPEQAARAADLARRQRQIRERLQAALAEQVGPQQDLRREAQALARELAELRDRAKEINAQNQWQANSAADLAGEHAPRAMEKGVEQLAQGKPDQARGEQRQAADFLERAARDTEDFAAGLRAEGAREAGEASAAANAAAKGLAEARESLRNLARQLAQGPSGPATAQAAAPGMRQAADNLRAAAETPGSGPAPPPMMGDPNSDNPNATAQAAGVAEADLSALQDLVRKKTGRQWGELPGHLRTEILQLSKGRYRDDYARLIQLYFREIAVDAGKAEKP